MWYRVAADTVVVVHLLFIGFVIFGSFLAWRWPRAAWVHVPVAVYGAMVEFVGFTCPLTPLENDLRRRAGETGNWLKLTPVRGPGARDLPLGGVDLRPE